MLEPELDAEIDLDEIPDDLPVVETGCAGSEDEGVALAVTDLRPERASGREYPPSALASIYTRIDPHYKTMRRSGIVGDAGHRRGYHRGRAVLPSSDYSVQAPADKRGDGWACCGIDISFGPIEMKIATRRLMNACRPNSQGNYDPRIEPIREFFGTLNGDRVTGWNRYPSSNRKVGYTTSDSSHLWHVHISVFRQYATDEAKMRGVADVLNGVPLAAGPPPPDEGDDMPTQREIAEAVWNTDGIINNKGFASGSAGNFVSAEEALLGILRRAESIQGPVIDRLKTVETKLDALTAAVAKLIDEES